MKNYEVVREHSCDGTEKASRTFRALLAIGIAAILTGCVYADGGYYGHPVGYGPYYSGGLYIGGVHHGAQFGGHHVIGHSGFGHGGGLGHGGVSHGGGHGRH